MMVFIKPPCRIPPYLVFVCISDEFNEIIGDEFIPLLNKGRGAGFTVTAYTQTWSDVEARLKSAAKAGQVAGNFGTMVMFRCQEVKTIQMLLEKLPKVPMMRTVPGVFQHRCYRMAQVFFINPVIKIVFI